MQIVFLGDCNSFHMQLVEYASGCVYSHVGIVYHNTEMKRFLYKEKYIQIPPGRWIIHVTPSEYSDAIGPCHTGVIIQPYKSKYTKYNTWDIMHIDCNYDEDNAAITFLEQYYGQPYDHESLYLSSCLPIHVGHKDRFVCTTLIQKYLDMNGIKTTFTMCSPGVLYQQLLLTNNCTVVNAMRTKPFMNILLFILGTIGLGFCLLY